MTQPVAAETALTADALGTLVLSQHRRGYRFTMDAPLLAAFALDGADEGPLSALDLGTGCGVIALLLKRQRPRWTVRGLELQPALAALARSNAHRNGVEIDVVQADLRIDAPPGPHPLGLHQLVVANPPYFDATSGRHSPDDERAIARHDHHAPIAAVARFSRRTLADNGRLCLVYPAARLPALFAALSQHQLVPTRLRCIHSRPQAAAGAALVEARPRSRRPMVIEAPLVVHVTDGGFTSELTEQLRLCGALGTGVDR